MKTKISLLFSFLVLSAKLFAQQGFPFDNEILAFKHQDSLHYPPTNGILFIGSSSIRKWTDLEQRFAGQPIIRRGVGGCELNQLVNYYTPYILFPYHPRKIFIYAGENDIAAGKSAESVYENFTRLWMLIRRQLPTADVYFMSIKPSPSRAKYFGEMIKANNLIKTFIADKTRSHYIDVATVICKPGTTEPDTSLFQSDMLHLNSMGYDKWQAVLMPYVN